MPRKIRQLNEQHLHYSMLIEWSEEDQAYLVTLPEWADRVMIRESRYLGHLLRSKNATG